MNQVNSNNPTQFQMSLSNLVIYTKLPIRSVQCVSVCVNKSEQNCIQKYFHGIGQQRNIFPISLKDILHIRRPNLCLNKVIDKHYINISTHTTKNYQATSL